MFANSYYGFLGTIGELSPNRIWAIILGVLFAIVAVALLMASWTKWGQTKSLTKCIALAFLAHVWLLMYAYGTRFVVPGVGGGNQGGVGSDSSMMMSIMEPSMSEELADNTLEPATETDETDEAATPSEAAIEPWQAPLRPDKQDLPPLPAPLLTKIPELPAPSRDQSILSMPTAPAIEQELPNMEDLNQMAELLQSTNIQSTNFAINQAVAPSVPVVDMLTSEKQTMQSAPLRSVSQPTILRKADQQPVPASYQLRLSPHRGQFAMMNGGDVNTEAAVERALAWLARAQSSSGGWNAAEHGAGRDPISNANRPDGEYRHNAGLKANTAMTGLALLAFLGAGHTQYEGQYRDHVKAGLDYLRLQQLPSGDLSGRDQVGHEPTVRFARMYSHGMASLALTEVYGMTGDPLLRKAIQDACQYSIKAMNPNTGGWRYEFSTSDPGDMSQFGWQAMLLHSASNNQAVTLAPSTRTIMQRFLDSVSTGRHGGLAVYRPLSYRPSSADQATPAMTAEALASRLLLGFPLSPQAADEGQRLLLNNLPGQSQENLYYWYYATLAMYQLRGEPDPSQNATQVMPNAWTQWNVAIKQQLCSTQVPGGKHQGSWNPNCVWGSYGGRVYSTAIACMCLEVYYRYLPLYKQDQVANQWQPARR
ncbi:MAG: prenyltransferase/squalene oxidase repeat-containing protein [Pirellula sp.]